MASFVELPQLPACDANVFARAVRRVLEQQAAEAAAPSVGPRALMGRLPKVERLERGAEQLFSSLPPASADDEQAATYFSAIVEACYLVAAADGLAEPEGSAVAELIECATASAFTEARAEEVFEAYGQLLAEQGLEARLDAVADRLTDFVAREEAMGFAALVAVADRELADKEAVVLMALANRFDFSRGEVQAVVQRVAAALVRSVEEESP